jgi:uncharacterized protein (TIGR02145 family)
MPKTVTIFSPKFFILMSKLTTLSLIALIAVLLNACQKEDASPVSKISQPVFNSSKTYNTMTDQDGNIYKTIAIGTQTWMAENLRVTTYRDGTTIPELRSGQEWNTAEKGAFCNYNNTASADTILYYGRLYNWYAFTDNKNIAPEGWHVPTLEEWVQLYDHLGGLDAGGKLKEINNTHWKSPNSQADNSSGFTALPGGMRGADRFNGFENAPFGGAGESGVWWSSTEDSDWQAKSTQLHYGGGQGSVYGAISKESGLSIRCIKD